MRGLDVLVDTSKVKVFALVALPLNVPSDLVEVLNIVLAHVPDDRLEHDVSSLGQLFIFAWFLF